MHVVIESDATAHIWLTFLLQPGQAISSERQTAQRTDQAI